MRLAVLADIHGNLTALEAAWADLQSRGDFDEIWLIGDLAAFGPRPADCVRRVLELRAQCGEEKLRVIGGNTDRYLVHGSRSASTPAAADADGLRALAPAWNARDRALNWSVEQLAWEEYDFLRGIAGRELSLLAPDYGPVIGYHAIPGDDESTALRPDSPAEEALEIGLCDAVVPLEELRDRAREMAQEIATSAPLAVRSIRKTMRRGLADAFRLATDREQVEQDWLRQTNDFREGVRAMAERSTPNFTWTPTSRTDAGRSATHRRSVSSPSPLARDCSTRSTKRRARPVWSYKAVATSFKCSLRRGGR